MNKILFLLLLLPLSLSQREASPLSSTTATLQPLRVGDSMPNLLLTPLINHHREEMRLSAFGKELLLLDFWATWCTACLHHFPKLDSLQQQWDGRLQVLLVNAAGTGDDRQKVTAFVQKRLQRNGIPYKLPVLAEDTLLSRLFPHQLLPHYVWIHKGRVAAITSAEEVTAQNIEAVLAGRAVLKTKSDLQAFDRSKPLFAEGNGGDGRAVVYRSQFSAPIEGLGSGISTNRDSAGRILRLLHFNASLMQLLKYAYRIDAPRNRILLQVRDTVPFGPGSGTYCYELITPPVSRQEAGLRLQQELAYNFGYTVRKEKRWQPCLVLQQQGKIKKALSRKGPPEHNLGVPGVPHYLRHHPASLLVSVLDQIWPLPVIDETGLAVPLYLQLPENLEDRPAVTKALQAYGLTLVSALREIEVWVISDTPFTPL